MQEYIKNDEQIHQLTQTLAKFGRSFADQKSDDSHTNLNLDLIGKTIWGRWAKLNNGEYILGLNLETLQFILLNKNQELVTNFDISGKTQETVEQEIASFISTHLKADDQDFLKPLHFEIPSYSFINDPVQPFKRDTLSSWLKYRQLANDVCQLMANHLNLEAETRIWPHHFDTGLYVEATDELGIGFGWAMADKMHPGPYYYFAIYGLNGHKPDYTTVQPLSIGNWSISDKWKGAVLPIQESNLDNCLTFIKETTSWALKK